VSLLLAVVAGCVLELRASLGTMTMVLAQCIWRIIFPRFVDLVVGPSRDRVALFGSSLESLNILF